MAVPGAMTATCSVCGKVKEGPLVTVRPGQPQPAFVCFDCLRKQTAA